MSFNIQRQIENQVLIKTSVPSLEIMLKGLKELNVYQNQTPTQFTQRKSAIT